MLARNTFLALIPKPYYITSVQRHIRCCSVLLANQEKKAKWFQLPDKLKTKQIAVENKFRKRFPRFAEVLFRVRDGVKAVLSDSKDMIILQSSIVRGTRQVEDFSLRELEKIHETNIHLKRMVPIFVIFAIPVLGNFIVAFLVYIKPLRFLSPHFWTDKQKIVNAKTEHANRQSVFPPIIGYLDAKSRRSSKLGFKFLNVLESVQKGSAPNLTELVACKELFNADQIFSLTELPTSHLDNLLTLHSQKSFLLKLLYLREWGSYLKLVDQNISRNGGASKLSSEQLKKYCFQRGVNAYAMTEEEMCNYLNQWIAFSAQIPIHNISLLLHAPAIIGFSHKSNLTVTDDDSL